MDERDFIAHFQVQRAGNVELEIGGDGVVRGLFKDEQSLRRDRVRQGEMEVFKTAELPGLDALALHDERVASEIVVAAVDIS